MTFVFKISSNLLEGLCWDDLGFDAVDDLSGRHYKLSISCTGAEQPYPT